MPKCQAPTERDRYWLDQEAALAKSGKTAKDYAAEQGLSLHALYQARKRLRKLGHLTAGNERKSQKRRASHELAFEEVRVAPQASLADYRLSLPNGLVLEWSGEELPEPVVSLVERLVRLR